MVGHGYASAGERADQWVPEKSVYYLLEEVGEKLEGMKGTCCLVEVDFLVPAIYHQY